MTVCSRKTKTKIEDQNVARTSNIWTNTFYTILCVLTADSLFDGFIVAAITAGEQERVSERASENVFDFGFGTEDTAADVLHGRW